MARDGDLPRRADQIGVLHLNPAALAGFHHLRGVPVAAGEAKAFAAKVDKFLMEREQSLLSKLVTIGGATQEESFEIQTKVRIEDSAAVIEKINMPDIVIEQKKHYKQFDTYFRFNNTDQMIES